MIINTKVRYGLRAMMEIAKHSPDVGVLQKEISVKQQISLKYLDPIINSLKVANLIRKKSHKAGFVLTKSPDLINVYDIYKAFEPDILNVKCLDKNDTCAQELDCDVKGFWCELNSTIKEKFNSVTLANLLQKY